MNKKQKQTSKKTATFYLTDETINALQSIAEYLNKRGVVGMLNQDGKVNKSAVINYLVMQGAHHAAK